MCAVAFNLSFGSLSLRFFFCTSTYLHLSMLQYVVISLLFSVVVAFQSKVPLQRRPTIGPLTAFASEVGVVAPVGYFDPLGLSADGDEEKFLRYREAELKHGRVAMLAVLGYVIPEVFRFPAAINVEGVSFADIPNGVAALGAVPALGWAQIFFSVGWWELKGWKKASDEPGDFGFYRGKKPLTGEYRREQQTKELQNGRLAMIAILELLRHDAQMAVGGMYAGDHVITGLPFLYQ